MPNVIAINRSEYDNVYIDRIHQLEEQVAFYEKVAPVEYLNTISDLRKRNLELEKLNSSLMTEVELVKKGVERDVVRVKSEYEHKLLLSEHGKKTAWGNVADRNNKIKDLSSAVEIKEKQIDKIQSTISQQASALIMKDLKIEELREALDNVKETLRIVKSNNDMLVEANRKLSANSSILEDIHSKVSVVGNTIVDGDVRRCIPVRKTLFSGVNDAKSKINQCLDSYKLFKQYGIKGNKELAEKYGHKSTAAFKQVIKTMEEKGIYDIIVMFNDNNCESVELSKDFVDKYPDYDFSDVIEMLNKHSY